MVVADTAMAAVEVEDAPCLVVVGVFEGRNFPRRPQHRLVVEAQFHGERLCSEGAWHEPCPQLFTELALEMTRRSLHQHKLKRTPVKVTCYAVDTMSNRRESVGYFMLDLRSVQVGIATDPQWHTLQSCKYSQAKAQLRVVMDLEVDGQRGQRPNLDTFGPPPPGAAVTSSKGRKTMKNVQRKPPRVSKTTRAKPSTAPGQPGGTDAVSSRGTAVVPSSSTWDSDPALLPSNVHHALGHSPTGTTTTLSCVLDEQEGCFLIAPLDRRQHVEVFLLSLTVTSAKSLVQLVPPGMADPPSYHFYFSLLGNDITMEPFSSLLRCDFKAERATVRLKSSFETVVIFLAAQKPVMVHLCCGKQSLGCAVVEFAPLLNYDTSSRNRQRLSLSQAYILHSLEQQLAAGQSNGRHSDQDKPVVDVTVSLRPEKERPPFLASPSSHLSSPSTDNIATATGGSTASLIASAAVASAPHSAKDGDVIGAVAKQRERQPSPTVGVSDLTSSSSSSLAALLDLQAKAGGSKADGQKIPATSSSPSASDLSSVSHSSLTGTAHSHSHSQHHSPHRPALSEFPREHARAPRSVPSTAQSPPVAMVARSPGAPPSNPGADRPVLPGEFPTTSSLHHHRARASPPPPHVASSKSVRSHPVSTAEDGPTQYQYHHVDQQANHQYEYHSPGKQPITYTVATSHSNTRMSSTLTGTAESRTQPVALLQMTSPPVAMMSSSRQSATGREPSFSDPLRHRHLPHSQPQQPPPPPPHHSPSRQQQQQRREQQQQQQQHLERRPPSPVMTDSAESVELWLSEQCAHHFTVSIDLCCLRQINVPHIPDLMLQLRYSNPFFNTSSTIVTDPPLHVANGDKMATAVEDAEFYPRKSLCTFDFATRPAQLHAQCTSSPVLIELWQCSHGNPRKLLGATRLLLGNVLQAPRHRLAGESQGWRRSWSGQQSMLSLDSKPVAVCTLSVHMSIEDHGSVQLEGPSSLLAPGLAIPTVTSVSARHHRPADRTPAVSTAGAVPTHPSDAVGVSIATSGMGHVSPTPSCETVVLSRNQQHPPTNLGVAHRDSAVYQAALELELWKATEEEQYREQLETRKKHQLQVLADEWKRRDLERERSVKKKIEEYEKLEQQLRVALTDVESKEKALKQAQQETSMLKASLEAQKSRLAGEVRETTGRLQDSFRHQLEIERSRTQEAESQRAHLQQQLLDLQTLVSRREEELATCRSERNAQPEVKLQAEMSIVQMEKAELSRKLESCQRSKSHYKDQWARALRELARYRQQQQKAERERLLEQQRELGHMRLRYLAAEEKTMMVATATNAPAAPGSGSVPAPIAAAASRQQQGDDNGATNARELQRLREEIAVLRQAAGLPSSNTTAITTTSSTPMMTSLANRPPPPVITAAVSYAAAGGNSPSKHRPHHHHHDPGGAGRVGTATAADRSAAADDALSVSSSVQSRDEHLARLIGERDTLLRTGVYTHSDHVIQELDRQIRQVMAAA